MKLFLICVLASMLLLKTAEGAAGALGDVCVDGTPKTCTDANTKCNDGGTACVCVAGYTSDGAATPVCKKNTGEECTEASECLINACDASKKCGKAKDAVCTMNTDCVSFNCKYMEDKTEKCADSGVAGVVTSVLLMVATLVTSRIL